jgi:tetratricopeptide (TPR) repeat protein
MAHPKRTSQFTIYGLLYITIVVAWTAAFDRDGNTISMLLFGGVLLIICLGIYLIGILACTGVFHLQYFIARNLLPACIHSKSLFWLRLVCSEQYTLWAFLDLSSKLIQKGQYSEAIAILSHAIRWNARNAQLWQQRGIVHYGLRDYPSAVSDLNAAIEIDGSDVLSKKYLALAMIATKQNARALEVLTPLELQQPEDSVIAHWRGFLHECHGNWQLASIDYLLATQLDVGNQAAGIALARLQAGCPDASFRNGEKSIENSLNLCLRSDWKQWEPISVLAAGYATIGNFRQAIEYSKIAMDLAPESEKNSRKLRMEQYEQHIPFRIESPPRESPLIDEEPSA